MSFYVAPVEIKDFTKQVKGVDVAVNFLHIGKNYWHVMSDGEIPFFSCFENGIVGLISSPTQVRQNVSRPSPIFFLSEGKSYFLNFRPSVSDVDNSDSGDKRFKTLPFASEVNYADSQLRTVSGVKFVSGKLLPQK